MILIEYDLRSRRVHDRDRRVCQNYYDSSTYSVVRKSGNRSCERLRQNRKIEPRFQSIKTVEALVGLLNLTFESRSPQTHHSNVKFKSSTRNKYLASWFFDSNICTRRSSVWDANVGIKPLMFHVSPQSAL